MFRFSGAVLGPPALLISGVGCALEKPPTSLGRPLACLLELDLVHRDVPLGSRLRESQRTAYRLKRPLPPVPAGAGQTAEVAHEVEHGLPTRWSSRVCCREQAPEASYLRDSGLPSCGRCDRPL